MKKTIKSLLIFLLFLSTSIYAQDRECIIFFHEGDSIEGVGQIKNNKVKFKITPDSKADSWDFETISKIKFVGYGFEETYEYVKLNSFDNPKLLELVLDGEVYLYRMAKLQYYTTMNSSPGSFPQGGASYSNTTEQFTEFYYLKRKKEQYPTYINLGILSNWKKTATNYFSDCDILIKKIKDKKFNSTQIKEIVEYYNYICHEQ
ncbi:hypothetical protein [Flavobacterium sp. ABG]|uniref:hypothetical protein n=1 Tax=Flavobacterium sp. ABG TaxID=1423322 RepID=UPI00064A7366|nr:hypothetical protein [Flavobacterium sp. ABG]KLT68570.1 hypothetical protein AB674_17225 [Flavobacterium sp. ABG]